MQFRRSNSTEQFRRAAPRTNAPSAGFDSARPARDTDANDFLIDIRRSFLFSRTDTPPGPFDDVAGIMFATTLESKDPIRRESDN